MYYDVCVLGSELSALAAAALLAQSGKRVIVLDVNPPVQTQLLGEHQAPLSHQLWQLPQHGPALQVFEQLELKAELKRLFPYKSAIAFINDPTERLLFDPKPQKIAEELRRAFPGTSGSMISYLEHIPPNSLDELLTEACLLHERGLLGIYQQKKRYRQLGGQEALRIPSPFLNSLQQTELHPYLRALLPFVQQGYHTADGPHHYLAARCLFGVHLPLQPEVNTRQILTSLLLSSIKRHGGVICENRPVAQMHFVRSYLNGIQIDGYHQQILAGVYLEACGGELLTYHCGEIKAKQELLSFYAAMQPINTGAGVRWLLPRTSLPLALPNISVLMDEDSRQTPATLLSIQHLSAKPDWVIASTIVPHHPSGEQEALKLATSRIHQALPYALTKAAATDTVSCSQIKRLFPTYQGCELASPILGGLPLFTPVKNLLHTGQNLAPTLGIDGELASAHALYQATQAILARATHPVLGLIDRLAHGKKSAKLYSENTHIPVDP